MPTTITGTDGVSQVQAGAVESGDLPAGSVIQVVQDSTTTKTSITSTSYSTTTLSGSITPSSSNSKILILVNQHSFLRSDNNLEIYGDLTLARDGVNLFTSSQSFRITGEANSVGELRSMGREPINYLDTPSTTNTITYSTVAKITQTSGQTVTFQNANAKSFITLMEIAG